MIDAATAQKAVNLSSLRQPEEVTEIRTRTEGGQIVYYEHNYYLKSIDENKAWISNPHGKHHLELKKEDVPTYFVCYYILD